MSFVFPVILGGLAAASVPILLHLIMRQKPKILPFPAFRFLVQRSKTNLRKLRLRHLLLLVLRILLLAAICLALARPKLVTSALNLSTDRPVAAIFLFDTSYSMGYSSGKLERLEEARKRGLELLDELPQGSKIAVLDTAEAAASRGEWLENTKDARERIRAPALVKKPANGPVTARLQDAYRLFADLARNQETDPKKELPRFLCVFSDRTRAAWDAGQMSDVYDKADLVPPTIAGLRKLGEETPALIDALKELRQKLPPPPGQDYPEQALIDGLVALRDRIPGLTSEDLPADRELPKQLAAVRRPARQLLATLKKEGEAAQEKEYRERLIAALHQALTALHGVHAVFIDVGIDKPTDLAIVELEFPRNHLGQPQQVFPRDRPFVFSAKVRATGKGYNTDLICDVGKKEIRQPFTLKPGETQTFPFAIDPQELKLPDGPNSIVVRLGDKNFDLLDFTNQRYATFAVRKPQRVLVIADEPAKADDFAGALRANRFAPSVRSTQDVVKAGKLGDTQAVYLFDVAQPTEELWGLLEAFVKRGGGLGIILGGQEVKPEAYNNGAAQKLMPGRLENIVKLDAPAQTLAAEKKQKKSAPLRTSQPAFALWNLHEDAIFQHPLMRPFRDWKDNPNIDLVKEPRRTMRFWQVEPYAGKGVPLVHYQPRKQGALWERHFAKDQGDMGHVLLFTTTFDKGREPAWNDYLGLNSFYVVITALATRYLVGATEEPALNFNSGQAPPTVRLPAARNFRRYLLQGPGDPGDVIVDEQRNDLVLRQAVEPGNYVLEAYPKGDSNSTERIAAFSVNIPPEESDLTRVPAAEIEALFGSGAVLGVDRKVAIRDAMPGLWNEPVELFPFLMVLLLVVLAVENLLANKFYKREEETA